MKISKRGLEIFLKNHEIYETLKRENFIMHLYNLHVSTLLSVLLLYSLIHPPRTGAESQTNPGSGEVGSTLKGPKRHQVV